MLRRAWIVIFICFFLVFTGPTFALDIKTDNYNVYVGDVNGDGTSDYYFSGKPLILILHGDIATPIVIFSLTNFAIYRNGNGYSNAQVYNISSTTLAQKLSAGTLKIAVFNTDYFIWANTNSAQTNILLRGADIYSPSVIIANFSGSLLPMVVQTYPSASPLNANISNKAFNVSIQDANSDGKMDILVGPFLYLADVSSIPGLTPIYANQSGPIVTTFIYDDLGRLTQTQVTNGTNSNYHYDSQDNRTSHDTTKGVSP